ncbi:hypothetical protein QE152_g8756 [Popillia japonica]|uniref:Uncharacterized protein n=1 Tax=Popillia japonica TaxID=7064 RepID=A0AAW1M2U3_POPJA
MLLFLCSIIVASAAGVTAFLLLITGDFNKFRETFAEEKQREVVPKQLPIVTREGKIINTKVELEAQLELLRYNLQKSAADWTIRRVESSKPPTI